MHLKLSTELHDGVNYITKVQEKQTLKDFNLVCNYTQQSSRDSACDFKMYYHVSFVVLLENLCLLFEEVDIMMINVMMID